MPEERARAQERPIRVHATFGAFDASLPCSPSIRTLDLVNQLSSSVVLLRPRTLTPLGPPFDLGRLAIAKSSILLVHEVDPAPVTGGGKPRCRFWQAPVVLRIGEYVVVGSVHVPVGGDPLLRIHQSGPHFLALTSAVVRIGDSEIETPFLAVNRFLIVAAQKLEDPDENRDLAPASAASVSSAPDGG